MKPLTKERVIEAIDVEPELPGEMPDEIYQSVQGDKDALAELLRITVGETKRGIRNRISDLCPEPAKSEDKSAEEILIKVCGCKNDEKLDYSDDITVEETLEAMQEYADLKVRQKKVSNEATKKIDEIN
ncbi:MAG: hypothetical protein GYA14_15820 [Ignavibacteria bacterium]|nr:hypothetical protein [Ignavibacteria bacterium]